MSSWTEAGPGVVRAARGHDEIIGVSGPCFGVVTIRLTWFSGSVDYRPGAARAAWALLERGTAQRGRAQWYQALEQLGARVDARMGRTSCSVEIDALEGAIDEALTLALEALLSPTEEPEELQDWRAETREDLAAELEDAEGVLQRVVSARLWASHRWAAPAFGSHAQRESESLDTLAACRRELLAAPAVMTIAADAPDAHLGRAVEILDTLRSRFPCRGVPEREPPALRPGSAAVHHPGAQGGLRFAVPAPSPDSELWAAAVVYGTGFGGGFVSPWVARVRGELGLAYDVSWTTSALPGSGVWLGRALPAGADVPRVLSEWESLWRGYAEAPPSPEALETARALAVSGHLATLDTAAARAAYAGYLRVLGLPLSRLWRFCSSLEAVDESAWLAVAARAGDEADATWVAVADHDRTVVEAGERWSVDPAKGIASQLAKTGGCQ